ncbi:Kp4 domain-containing protein [Fusarium keratoplasticum]|nr:Kp4 domain-containing protein [Fusarium keratoplasticum]
MDPTQQSSTFINASMQITAIIATALLAARQAAAGINCKGSSSCGTSTNSLGDLVNLANYVDHSRWYQNGEHIVCADNLCAFLQNTGGMPGTKIRSLLVELSNHGCKKCGSVPVFFPDDNDEKSHGILTVNIVSKPQCKWAACKK